MRGLKTQETSKFLNFFSIVQNTANKKECVFFLDAGDGNNLETEIFEFENLMGWLIPNDKADEFEKAWKENDVSDDWSDFYVWANWENHNSPIVKFS